MALYIKHGINCTVRDDLGAYSRIDFDCVYIELPVIHQRKNIVGCIYRAPGLDLRLFKNEFEQLICKITSENADLFQVGDYNINLHFYEYKEDTADFVNHLCSHLSLALINRPTWFTENTSTINIQ